LLRDRGPSLLLTADGSGPNLSMFQRSHASAHRPAPGKVAALRLPFANNPRRAAGQGVQASRLSARKGNGRGRTRPKLDDLFVAEQARARTQSEPEMSSGM